LFPFAVIVSVMVFVGISPAFAVCPAGKTSVTIVNPANKSIELCVPDAVVGNIGNGTDIVIPASCPCFSPDDLDRFWASGKTFTCSVGLGSTGTEPCTRVFCISDDWTVEFNAQEGPDLSDPKSPTCSHFVFSPLHPAAELLLPYNNWCEAWIDPNNTEFGPITAAEGDACVAILKTFVKGP
jgi:hypothetical protein